MRAEIRMRQNTLMEIIEDQTKRALWEVKNVIDCVPDELWMEHKLPLGWQILAPENWRQEAGENGEQVLYPSEGELTVRITPFHAEKSGKPAPAKIMEQAFLQTIPPEAVRIKPEGYSLPGFRVKFFENMESEGELPVCHIYGGYFSKGELLSVNIYGRDKKECAAAMAILDTLQREADDGR